MKKAVIYARYSCEKQTEISIEGQLEVCKKYAVEHDYYVVDTYIDRAVSGRTDQRDGFQQMLKDSALKSFEAVIVYKLDRFSRDKYESAIHRHALRQNGVQLISAMENIPDTPEGIILESVLEGLNQYYSLELAQKVSRTFRILRNEGKFVGGRVPYGYQIVDKKYVVDSTTAPLIQKVFDEVIKGKRIIDIQHENPEVPVNIHKLVKNIKYMGCLMHQGEIIENVIPAIVTKETFEKAQQMVKQTEKQYTYRPAYDYILSGKVYCGKCGKRMTGGYSISKTGTQYRYYNCKSPCDLKRIHCDELESAIIEVVLSVLNDNQAVKAIAANTVKLAKARASKTDTSKFKNRLFEIKRKKKNILDAIENLGYTPDMKERLDKLCIEEDRLSIEISKSNNVGITEKQIIDTLQSYVSYPPEELRYAILKNIVSRVDVFNDHFIITIGNGRITEDSDRESQEDSGITVTNFEQDNTSVTKLSLIQKIVVYETRFIIEVRRKKASRY